MVTSMRRLDDPDLFLAHKPTGYQYHLHWQHTHPQRSRLNMARLRPSDRRPEGVMHISRVTAYLIFRDDGRVEYRIGLWELAKPQFFSTRYTAAIGRESFLREAEGLLLAHLADCSLRGSEGGWSRSDTRCPNCPPEESAPRPGQ